MDDLREQLLTDAFALKLRQQRQDNNLTGFTISEAIAGHHVANGANVARQLAGGYVVAPRGDGDTSCGEPLSRNSVLPGLAAQLDACGGV